MDEKLVQSIVANLSESYARKNQALEIDLAVARAERDQAVSRLKEIEDAEGQPDVKSDEPS